MSISPSHDNNKALTIIQITDTHLMDQDNLTFVEVKPIESFKGVLKDIQKNYPDTDAIFHTGDLAQVATPTTYAHYLTHMKRLNIPFYQIPGNHDKAEYFPFYNNSNQVHAITLGSWTVILLNTAVENHIHGCITDEHLKQLDQLLAENPEQHVILTCHHHPLDVQSAWIDQHKLQNTEQLSKIVEKHSNIKLILFGHVHQDSVHFWKNIPVFSTPSTCVQFKPHSDEFALDDIAPGYRVLHLQSDGRFNTEIHRLNKLKQKINTQISGY